MSATVKRELSGRLDPFLDPFSAQGRTIRDRQCRTAVRLRREGHTMAEIGQALGIPEEHARIFIRSREPKLLLDTKQWALARRGRLLAQLEREHVGERVFLTRVKAVLEAGNAGDLNILIGSLNDAAGAAVAWAQWLRAHRDR